MDVTLRVNDELSQTCRAVKDDFLAIANAGHVAKAEWLSREFRDRVANDAICRCFQYAGPCGEVVLTLRPSAAFRRFATTARRMRDRIAI